MGVYCTIKDVRDRNSILLSESSISDELINGYIAFAEGLVDGKLTERYPVPLASVPAVIKNIVADLAASKCLFKEVANTGENDEPVQSEKLWNQAMRLLDDVADGTISLFPKKQKTPAYSSTYGQEPRFLNWDPTNPRTYR